MTQIRLLTFNCSAIPLLTPRVRWRLDHLVDEVERLDPDILCLQEVGLDWDARYLKKRLKRLPHSWWTRGRPGLVAGGLAMFSRRPFAKASFIPYEEQGPWLGLGLMCRLSRKGMMLVEWDQPRLRLLHTHPLPDYNRTVRAKADYGALQARQHLQLAETARRLVESDRSPFALVGDLNVAPDYPTLRWMEESLGLVDLMAGVRESSMVEERDFRSPFGIGKRFERIDYIMVQPGSPVRSAGTADYCLDQTWLLGKRELTLSDHRAVLGCFAV